MTISTEKEDDNDWKSAGNFIIPIGEIEDMSYDKKPAVVRYISVCYKKLNSTKHKFFKNNYTPIHGVVKLR